MNQEETVRALDRQRAQERLRAASRGKMLLASIEVSRREQVERQVIAGIVQRLMEVLDASHFDDAAADALDDAACDLDLGPDDELFNIKDSQVLVDRLHAYTIWTDEMEEKVKDAIHDALEERWSEPTEGG